jgi:phage/plasmid-associated DNA primase
MTRMVAAPTTRRRPAPLFEMVVREAQPDAADRGYLQRVLGYMSTGSVEEQKFFVFQGKGGDGKSTIVNAVRHTLGTYATTVAVETFLDTGVKRGSRGLARHRRAGRRHPVPVRRRAALGVEAGDRGDQDLHRRRQP